MDPSRGVTFGKFIALCAVVCLAGSLCNASQSMTTTNPTLRANATAPSSTAPKENATIATTSSVSQVSASSTATGNGSTTRNPMSYSTQEMNNSTKNTSESTTNVTQLTGFSHVTGEGITTRNPMPYSTTVNDAITKATTPKRSSPIASTNGGLYHTNETSRPPTPTTTSPVCGTPNDCACHRSIDHNGKTGVLCKWNEDRRLEGYNYTVNCVVNSQRGKFNGTTNHNYILFENIQLGNNNKCTLQHNKKGCTQLQETCVIKITKQESDAGKIVTIVLLLIAVIVCLFIVRKFYVKNKKIERQYSSEEGVCLLPKALWGFQKETIVTNMDPIPAKVFRQTVQSKSTSNCKVFHQEFSTIPRVIEKYSQQEATQPQNSKKNRYSDILPYDQNRVKLSSDGGSGSDYINASYIDGYKSSVRYIAAQGPLEHTAGDFWQMIWEKKISVIVMVTKCEEMGKVKCFQYWPHPNEDNRTFGNITVTVIDEKPYADIVIRTFSITHCKHKGFGAHTVSHVQFVSWPDHGVPENPNLLLKLRRRVNAFNGAGCTAVVVHCSAGVGRSGTYIGLDCLARQLENEGQADVYGCVFRLRHQRPLMVQVESQYVLLHRALLEHHLFGNTELSIPKLHARVQAMKVTDSQQDESIVDVEFKRLPTFEDTFAQKAGKNNNNFGKNRNTNVIPYDFNRVKLWKFTPSKSDCEDDEDNYSDGDDNIESDNENSDKDYINASFMDGYHKQKTYIATQNPLPDTVSDFWLMVVQQNCSHIVMLSEGEKEQCAHYWPVKGTQNYGTVKVTARNEVSKDELTVRPFAVVHEGKESVVTQYQCAHWKPDGLPKSPKPLIAIINAIQGYQKRNGNDGHIVVHCSDGASRSGTFCALWNTLEAACVERMVDLFQAVKWLKMQRPGVVKNKVHYRFLYKTVSIFMNSTNSVQYAYQVAQENDGSMCSVDLISEL